MGFETYELQILALILVWVGIVCVFGLGPLLRCAVYVKQRLYWRRVQKHERDNARLRRRIREGK